MSLKQSRCLHSDKESAPPPYSSKGVLQYSVLIADGVSFPPPGGLKEVNLGHYNEVNVLMFVKRFSLHNVFMLHFATAL